MAKIFIVLGNEKNLRFKTVQTHTFSKTFSSFDHCHRRRRLQLRRPEELLQPGELLLRREDQLADGRRRRAGPLRKTARGRRLRAGVQQKVRQVGGGQKALCPANGRPQAVPRLSL